MDLPDLARLLLRLTVGGLFALHGLAKLRRGAASIGDQLVAHGLPAALSNLVFLGEVLGPLLVILGIGTRIGGGLIAATMLVAVWLMHLGDLGSFGRSGGWALELQALYLVGGVCIALLGAGRYAVTRGRGSWD